MTDEIVPFRVPARPLLADEIVPYALLVLARPLKPENKLYRTNCFVYLPQHESSLPVYFI